MEHHAKYSPSKLSRIKRCPGSVSLIDSMGKQSESKTSSYAKEGTLKHERVADFLASQSKLTYDELPVDVQECIDYANILQSIDKEDTGQMFIEQHVSLKSVGLPDTYGTLDFAYMSADSMTIDIVDWKFGFLKVDIKSNDQLMAYAAGFHASVCYLSALAQIRIHIVQPAIQSVEVLTITVNDIEDWIAETKDILDSIQLSTKPVYKPSAKACRWCEANVICKANKEYNMETASKAFEAYSCINEKDNIQAKDLIEVLNRAKAFNAYIKAINDYIYSCLNTGKGFPGYKLVKGRGTRTWIDELDVVEFFDNSKQIDDLYVSKLMSPAQCEKAVKHLKKDASFQDLYTIRYGAPLAVPESDKRPEYKTTKAFDKFVDN